MKDWKKCSTDFDGHFQAAREAVPEISAAHGVIVHVPHHDPLLFSATGGRGYKRQHFHLLCQLSEFFLMSQMAESKQE